MATLAAAARTPPRHRHALSDAAATPPPLRGAYLLLRGGAVSGTDPTAATLLLVATWYGSSVCSSLLAYELVAAAGPEMMTLCHFAGSACCGAAVLRLGGRSGSIGFASRRQLVDTAALSASFLAGCYTMNSCQASMHLSLAHALRAFEPVTTLLLTAAFLPSDTPSARRAACLLPVALGCALSAAGAHGPTARSLGLVTASNLCFSLRGILARRVKARHGTGTGPVTILAGLLVAPAALTRLNCAGVALACAGAVAYGVV
ncbi:hypothetical protein EMIHUDRAFT_239846 [Emiliania huxleyi CCMP1516]|uniref:Sugar phosphate transporter domain-containing protein n=2 Tax=Emiliania huxleyi TaxID=2903 RepID=A0A0D3JIG9_EMIH1|nr:hypothetical protein EMIHUDRAFT_239846 [Emiliania huxleyi CCMP1516]EOD23304.1 hypothetical protein EMIHUDRAFT_239846 [Emiliania huxleyi CCMP1516]|eukprot:XP_005775733.1 hypothetical protein EMIHUDRAFT_239846 [Emiliania huxleyi CCMP1516]